MGGVEEMFMEFMAEFTKLSNDRSRWEFLLTNRHVGWTLILGNDTTYITHNDVEECEWSSFSQSIGNSPGLCAMLETLQIKWEFC